MLRKFFQRFPSRPRVRTILQTESAECGLACVAMVASHHGYHSDLEPLRQRFKPSQKGSTLVHLMRWCGELGLTARPLRANLDHLAQVRLPAILHWNFDHFVVLVAVTAEHVDIIDPAKGERRVSRPELSDCYTGVTLEVDKAPGFTPASQQMALRLRDLLPSMADLRRPALQILGFALALELFAVLAPLFVQQAVDASANASAWASIAPLAVGFGLLVLVQAAVAALRSYTLIHLSVTLNHRLINGLFAHLLRLPLGFFYRRQLGDILSRFESINAIQRTVTGSFLEALLDGVMAAATLAMMLLYAPALALVVLGCSIAYAALRVRLYGPSRIASENHISKLARQQTHLLETLRAIQSVKLFGIESQRSAAWDNLVVDAFNTGSHVQRLALIYNACSTIVFGLENVAVIALGAIAISRGDMSVGMLFAFLAYKLQFVARVRSVTEKAMEFRMLTLHRDRVSDVALTAPEPRDENEAGLAEDVVPELEVDNVSFRYADGDPPVLSNVSFRVEAGESVAIVGPTGSGKTTLLKIMLGLLQPSEGQVRLGGVQLQDIGLTRYRSLVAAVMQDDQLFAGSIADNISLFDPEAQMTKVRYVAALAGIHAEILAMPMAYQTLVGDMGSSLSGGQKQRVLLARALYREPKVLFLDEATSHLDIVTERAVSDAVRRIRLTRVIIAHRPETIAMAGRVIELRPLAQSVAAAGESSSVKGALRSTALDAA